MIAAALERHNGNRTHACEELQVSRWWLVAGGWWLVAGGWCRRSRPTDSVTEYLIAQTPLGVHRVLGLT
jgi:hypothetical protein